VPGYCVIGVFYNGELRDGAGSNFEVEREREESDDLKVDDTRIHFL